MIKISPAAASIFKKEIDKEENKGFKLRIAVMKKDGNNFHYALDLMIILLVTMKHLMWMVLR